MWRSHWHSVWSSIAHWLQQTWPTLSIPVSIKLYHLSADISSIIRKSIAPNLNAWCYFRFHSCDMYFFLDRRPLESSYQIWCACVRPHPCPAIQLITIACNVIRLNSIGVVQFIWFCQLDKRKSRTITIISASVLLPSMQDQWSGAMHKKATVGHSIFGLSTTLEINQMCLNVFLTKDAAIAIDFMPIW